MWLVVPALVAAIAIRAIERWWSAQARVDGRWVARRGEELRRGDRVVYEARDRAFCVRRVAALEGDPMPRWSTAIELVPRGRLAVGGGRQRPPAFIARSAVVARLSERRRGRAGGPSAGPSARGRR